MRVGIPKEIKNGETRVSLTPQNVAYLVSQGVEVRVETNAGASSFFSDSEYESAGAQICKSRTSVWNNADLVVKVKEPLREEFSFFRKDLTLFTFLHPAAFPEMTTSLLTSGSRAYSYDLLKDEEGRLPILHPMSVIAGTIALYAGSNALFSSCGGRGVLLSSVCNLDPGEVLIFGAGSAGAAAARTASQFGARTHVIDINETKLQLLQEELPNVSVYTSSESVRVDRLSSADLVVSAVLVPGAKAPKILTRSLIAQMKPGAVFVDIAIDQGGSSETSRATSIAEPTYIQQDIVHYCVPNIPALSSQTATIALTQASFPYVCSLAGIKASSQELNESTGVVSHGTDIERNLSGALLCENGQLINEVVKEALGR